jgi:Integral membrane protein EMC3/TMCO1-like
MAELLLDSDIRIWVFLPIVVITFLVGIIRHYVTILLSTEKKVELQQIADRLVCFITSITVCITVYRFHQGRRSTVIITSLSICKPHGLQSVDANSIPCGMEQVISSSLSSLSFAPYRTIKPPTVFEGAL